MSRASSHVCSFRFGLPHGGAPSRTSHSASMSVVWVISSREMQLKPQERNKNKGSRQSLDRTVDCHDRSVAWPPGVALGRKVGGLQVFGAFDLGLATGRHLSSHHSDSREKPDGWAPGLWVVNAHSGWWRRSGRRRRNPANTRVSIASLGRGGAPLLAGHRKTRSMDKPVSK